MSKKSVVILLSFLTALLSIAAKADKQETFFPRGVYWPWERTARVAKINKLDKWQLTDRLMGELRNKYNCNLIWGIHLGRDYKKFCELAQKHKIKVILPSTLLNLSVWGFGSRKSISKEAQKTVKLFGKLPACYAYTLKDEPKKVEAEQLNLYYKALKKCDPSKAIVPVVEIRHIEAYFRQTELKLLCVDPYGFGSKDSPYLPNTPEGGQKYYRDSLTALNRLSQKTGKSYWAMPQAFAEMWGKFYTDKDANIILSPGTYLHWRMPSNAEIRWQCWESLRLNSKGIVFFNLMPSAVDWKPSNGKPAPAGMLKQMEKAKKAKLPTSTDIVNTGTSDALLRENLKPTTQFLVVADFYNKLKKVEDKLINMRQTPVPTVFAKKTFSDNSFSNGESNYAVIVNDNLNKKCKQKIFFSSSISSVNDLISGRKLELKQETGSTLKYAWLELLPGGGTVLGMETNQTPGYRLFLEDFSIRPVGVKFVNMSLKYMSAGWGIPSRWLAVPKTVPAAIEINNIVRSHPEKVTVTAGFPKKSSNIYINIEGKLNGVSIEILDKEGKNIKTKDREFYLPFLLPPASKRIIIKIAGKGTQINKILIWCAAKPVKK